MKMIVAFLMAVLLLCGCGEQQYVDQAIALRQKLISSGCSFSCAVTADYSDRLYSFKLDCSFDENGDMSFCVMEPDSISGITGSIDDDGGKLTFDNQALAFPLLADSYVSPVSAPWLFMRSLRSGYIAACGQEGELLRVELHDSYAEESMQLDVWLDADSIPVRCEMVWLGRRILSLDVTNFSYL